VHAAHLENPTKLLTKKLKTLTESFLNKCTFREHSNKVLKFTRNAYFGVVHKIIHKNCIGFPASGFDEIGF
jgi:hypothetical protein